MVATGILVEESEEVDTVEILGGFTMMKDDGLAVVKIRLNMSSSNRSLKGN